MKLTDFATHGLKLDRLKWLCGTSEYARGSHVLYWMQVSVRTRFNYALHAAITAANKLQKPLYVLYTIDTRETAMSEQHMAFLLESLRDVNETFSSSLNIPFGAIHCSPGSPSPADVVLQASKSAALVVTDHPYLRAERTMCETFVAKSKAPVLQVEADVVIPVATVSKFEEPSTGTIRPKINKIMSDYLLPLHDIRYRAPTTEIPSLHSLIARKVNWMDLSKSVDELLAASPNLDRSVPRVSTYLGGETEAQKTLEIFLHDKLFDYETERNKPDKDATSNLSPYLSYGNISPVDVALRVLTTDGKEPEMTVSRNHLIDEMVVRRELAINFVWYNRHDYDTIASLSPIATNTLNKHASDPRQYTYSENVLEQGRTHDAIWNACQLDMISTGKMQGYLRMYWGKKILEWSADLTTAYLFAVTQNAKYNLDGYDPNGYAGVAWVFGKHDRQFAERAIYGTVRYMGSRRLNDIFDIPAYITLVRERCAAANIQLQPNQLDHNGNHSASNQKSNHENSSNKKKRGPRQRKQANIKMHPSVVYQTPVEAM